MSEPLRIDPELRSGGAALDFCKYQAQDSVARLASACYSATPLWTREAALLNLEGWDWQIRGERRIWRRDPNDVMSHWYSEEIAYEIATRGEE